MNKTEEYELVHVKLFDALLQGGNEQHAYHVGRILGFEKALELIGLSVEITSKISKNESN